MLYMNKQVTISSKNQITLPTSLLRQRGLVPGKHLYVTEQNGDIVLTPKSPLERFIEKGDAIIASNKRPSHLIDPVEERKKLQNEWDKNEQRINRH